MSQKKILFYLPLLLGIALSFSLHGLRTYIDYQDSDWASQVNIPDKFKEDPKFEKIREQILDRPLFMGADCYYWVLYASEMARDGKWRIRHNQYDNVPHGREVSWHSGYLWFLVGLGKLDSLFTGRNIVDGIEHAARWSNPILVGLFALFWAIVLWRRFNPYIGGVFPWLVFFLWSLHVSAGYGLVDHHALHNMLLLSQLLAIVIGGAGLFRRVSKDVIDDQDGCSSLQVPLLKDARRWFVVAGLFGAMGIWVGATQQALFIGCIGAGGALVILLFGGTQSGKGEGEDIRIAPELWRWWGFCGALFSLSFYLIEYFPGHMSMRLEVNHPLYALAWAGGAEAIYRIGSLRQGSLDLYEKRVQYRFLVLSLLGVAVLPLAVLFGPDQWHSFHDPIMRRVHDNIIEFLPPYHPQVHFSMQKMLVIFGLFPFSWLLAGILLWPVRTSRYHRALIVQVLVPSFALFGFYLLQVRWNSLLAVCFVVLALVSASALLERFGHWRLSCLWAVAILFSFLVPGNYIFFSDGYMGSRADRVNSRLSPLDNSLLAREIAINLFSENRDKEVRIIANNSFAPFLAYFGVGRSVSSLYWPNRDGVRDYALFFADLGEQQAITIARERDLTHVLFKIPGKGIARRAAWALYGSEDKEVIKKTLAYRLGDKPTTPPDWLEPLPMFYSPRSQKNGNVLYRIQLGGEK